MSPAPVGRRSRAQQERRPQPTPTARAATRGRVTGNVARPDSRYHDLQRGRPVPHQRAVELARDGQQQHRHVRAGRRLRHRQRAERVHARRAGRRVAQREPRSEDRDQRADRGAAAGQSAPEPPGQLRARHDRRPAGAAHRPVERVGRDRRPGSDRALHDAAERRIAVLRRSASRRARSTTSTAPCSARSSARSSSRGRVAEQVVIAVGDMCGPPRKNPGAEATAALARRIIKDHPGAIVLALGDNAYNRGKIDEYRDHYTPTWGQPDLLGRTYSCPGQPRLPHRRGRARTSSTSASSAPARRSAATSACRCPRPAGICVSLNSEVDQDAHSPQLQWLRQRSGRTPLQADPRHLAPAALGIGRAPRLEEAALVLERDVRGARRADPQRPRAPLRALRAAAAGSDSRSARVRACSSSAPAAASSPAGPRTRPNSEYARFDKYGVLKLTLRPDDATAGSSSTSTTACSTPANSPSTSEGREHGTQSHPHR